MSNDREEMSGGPGDGAPAEAVEYEWTSMKRQEWHHLDELYAGETSLYRVLRAVILLTREVRACDHK